MNLNITCPICSHNMIIGTPVHPGTLYTLWCTDCGHIEPIIYTREPRFRIATLDDIRDMVERVS